MNSSFEVKALGWALVAVVISCGTAGLASILINSMPDSSSSSFHDFSSPVATTDLIDQGRNDYEQSCSLCHGDEATGDEGPNLHRLPVSNAYITVMIKKGIKGEMPSFAQKYDERQIAALVSYLRSLP